MPLSGVVRLPPLHLPVSFLFFSAPTRAQWHGGSRTRLARSDKSHRRCRPKNAHRLDEQQRATTHYAMANNPQHRQIVNGSSCDWGFCQDNRTVENIFVLITASHTSILLVATLTGASLAPIAATSIFIHHPSAEVEVTAIQDLAMSNCWVSVLIHSNTFIRRGGTSCWVVGGWFFVGGRSHWSIGSLRFLEAVKGVLAVLRSYYLTQTSC